MLCSNCSQPIKSVVAIDIDGTLGDYHGQFRSFAEQYLGTFLPLEYPGGQEYSEFLGIEKQTYREIKLAYRQGGNKRWMPLYAGALSFMGMARNSGAEIWMATTRPWLRLDNIDPDTRHWLDRNKVEYDRMVYGEDKYKQLVTMIDKERIALVVDDLLEQCIAAFEAGIPEHRIWQPERSHNRNEKWINRAKLAKIADFAFRQPQEV